MPVLLTSPQANYVEKFDRISSAKLLIHYYYLATMLKLFYFIQ